jgi:hypothetical protein
MLCTDCFINPNGKVLFTYPAVCHMGKAMDIPSFVISHSKVAEKIIESIGVKVFEDHIQQIVKSCKIRNTFICYQCIVRPDKKIYPLEINGRI